MKTPKASAETVPFMIMTKAAPCRVCWIDGTAFAYKADGSKLLDAYHVHQSESYRTVYAVAHTHKNWTDGVCDCGYTCPHDEVDEEGECTICGKRFYVRGTYANGTIHYYGTISDALGDSAVTQATILRALTEECESWNGGDRSVTLDLNGWNLVVERIQAGHLILRDSSGIGSILAVKEIQKDGQVSGGERETRSPGDPQRLRKADRHRRQGG